MILTEEEAKAKICAERSYGRVNEAPCVASNCMAWRWYDAINRSGDNKAWRESDFVRRGYCGLAGPVHHVYKIGLVLAKLR